jgi:acyl carrier protein
MMGWKRGALAARFPSSTQGLSRTGRWSRVGELTMENVKQEIRQFVVTNYCFGQEAALGNEESCIENGVIDSTGILELVSFLEQRYMIDVDSEEIIPENLDTIDRMAQFVSKKLAQTAQRSLPQQA